MSCLDRSAHLLMTPQTTATSANWGLALAFGKAAVEFPSLLKQ